MMQCISSSKTYRIKEHGGNPICFFLTEQGEVSAIKKCLKMPSKELVARINVIVPMEQSITGSGFPLPASLFSFRLCANHCGKYKGELRHLLLCWKIVSLERKVCHFLVGTYSIVGLADSCKSPGNHCGFHCFICSTLLPLRFQKHPPFLWGASTLHTPTVDCRRAASYGTPPSGQCSIGPGWAPKPNLPNNIVLEIFNWE